MTMKILVMGLPGAGKTTLAIELCKLLPAVHFNADEVRQAINKDLGFSLADRLEQARRMGWLCSKVVKSGAFAVADFVCPTDSTRAAFAADYLIWVDRIEKGRFEDTNNLFQSPISYDIRISDNRPAERWAQEIRSQLREHLRLPPLSREQFSIMN